MSIEDELEKIMPLEDWLIAYQELQALRDWKAKARPFLESSLDRLTMYLNERTDENNVNHDGLRESYKSKIKILTELLGGSDEN